MATIKYPDSTTGAWKTLAGGMPSPPADGFLYGVRDNAWARAGSLFRNKVINGCGTVKNRTRPAGGSGAVNGFFCDRWQQVQSVAINTAACVSMGTDSLLGSGEFAASPYIADNIWAAATAVYGTVAANDHCHFSQIIWYEQVAEWKLGTSYCKPLFLSFAGVCKAGTGPITIGISLCNTDYTRCFVKNVTITDVAQKFYIAIPPITTGVFTNASKISMDLRFSVISGSTFTTATEGWNNNNFVAVTGASNLAAVANRHVRITEIQLEADAFTPYEFRNKAVEEQMCARYFQKSYHVNAHLTNVGLDDGIEETTGATGASIVRTIRFHVRMIANPTVQVYAGNGTAGYITLNGDVGNNVVANNIDNKGVSGFKVFYGAAGVSRVSFHWTANSEL